MTKFLNDLIISEESFYPKNNNRNAEIVQWLVSKGLGQVEDLELLKKQDLLDIVNRNQPKQEVEVTNFGTVD